MPIFDSAVKETNDVEAFNKVVVSAFRYDPVYRYFARSRFKIPLSEPLNEEQLDSTVRVKAHIEKGAILVEAYNYNAVAVFYPPGLEMASWNLSNASEELRYCFALVEKFKNSYFGSRKHWYLCTLGRNFHEKAVKGAISKIIKPVLEECKKSNVPMYLEASTEHSKEIYLHYGFKARELNIVGKGFFDTNGDVKEGGPGFKVYFMVFEPRESE